MTRATIAALGFHPVKGCRAVALERAEVSVRGLVSSGVGDREWMIVDAQNRFITQREHPRLALVAVGVDNGCLTLDAPAMRPLAIDPRITASAPRREVSVWRDTVAAIEAGEDAACWLGTFLGTPARLVRFAPEHVRACNEIYAGASGASTLFADGYPLLVIGDASLADLNARLAARGEAALPMNRFRPNLVLAGVEPYDEDHVDTIGIGGVVLRLVKPCVRCRVTTTDQATAAVGREPLSTLASYRMDTRFDGVTFGMNAIVVNRAGGTIEAGAQARVEYRF
jgi:uncharacterized protein YcbX